MKEDDIRPRELFDRYLELAAKDARQLLTERAQFVRVNCPACDNPDQEPAFEKLGFAYVLCRDCGSLYVSPRPPSRLLDAFYQDGESVKFWSTDYFVKTAEARRERMFKPRAKHVSEIVDRFKSPTASFVDIGSGFGIFLEEISALGRFKSVSGIEPGPDLAEVCRRKGFHVIMKTVETVSAEECRPNVMTSFEVLEHVFAPREFLAAARGLLAPGGILFFTTLTASGFDISVLWENSKSVCPPHHLNLLSTSGLARLVERAGLALIEQSTPGELDVDIVANAAAQYPELVLPRFVSSLLKSGPAARGEFQSFLSRNALSSHVWVIAKR